MKRELTILVEELRRLKEEGVTAVHVSDEAMGRLRERVGRLAPGSSESSTSASGTSEPPASSGQRRRSRFEMTGTARLPDFNPGPDVAAKLTTKPVAAHKKLPAPPVVTLPTGDKTVKWEALREQVLHCPTCLEHLNPGGQLVFGQGSLEAELFFVGEAPGAEEELAGEPFVGKAGEMLTRMIGAMGLKRDDVYIGNVMNWRPQTATGTGSRQPTAEELAFCLPFLLAQIEIVQPKVIVALGNTAVTALFGVDSKRRLKDIRGEWLDFKGTDTMVTFHPAYLVRNASKAVKRTAWEDLLKVMEKLGLEISEKQRNYFLPK